MDDLTDNANSIASTPLCLDYRKYAISRECTSDGWLLQNTPICAYSQNSYDKSNKCPKGYHQLEVTHENVGLCLLLTEPTAWDNVCITSGSPKTFLEIPEHYVENLKEYIKAVGLVWIPANLADGTVRWHLPGKLNEFIYTVDRNNQTNGCVLLNIVNNAWF